MNREEYEKSVKEILPSPEAPPEIKYKKDFTCPKCDSYEYCKHLRKFPVIPVELHCMLKHQDNPYFWEEIEKQYHMTQDQYIEHLENKLKSRLGK